MLKNAQKENNAMTFWNGPLWPETTNLSPKHTEVETFQS